MSVWWDSLDLLMKVLYCIAIPATLIFVIQTILALVGGAVGGSGVDFSDTSGLDFDSTGVDFDASGMGYDGGAGLSELADGADLDHGDLVLDGSHPTDFTIMRMFTLQGIVAFLTVFGWTAIASISTGMMSFVAIVVGVIFGFVAMFGVAKLLQLSKKLVESGTVDIRNAIGENGKVYIPIPAGDGGEGKVTMYVQGRFMEFSAVTTGDKDLGTGMSIRVVDLRGDTLVVEADR